MKKHPIQTQILRQLLSSENGLRYSQMQLEDVENDLFNYHLQYLVKEKLVAKSAGAYSLTLRGKKFIEDQMPLDPLGQTSDLLRVNVLAIVIRQGPRGFEILNQTRTRQPYYGNIGVLGGKVKPGEPIVETAKRKVIEEAGIEAEFTLRGIIRKMRYDEEGNLFTDIPFFVCTAENYQGQVTPQTVYGKNFWATLDETIKNERGSEQGSLRLIEMLESLKDRSVSDIPIFYYEEKKILKDF